MTDPRLDLTGSDANQDATPDTATVDANMPGPMARPVRTQRRGAKKGHRQPKPKLQSGTVGRSNYENAKHTVATAKMQRRPLSRHEKQLVAGAQGTLARRANEGKSRAKRKAARSARRKNR